MRFLAWMLIFCISGFVCAETNSEGGIEAVSQNTIFKTAADSYAQGKYQTTIEELKIIESKLSSPNKNVLGLVNYWKGICYNRLQEFPSAIESFDKSLALNYAPKDIHYEYGQALFASEKYSDARIQFRESLKRKFKRGVSLYYIGYISKEMGEKKKAYTFLKSIDKLDQDEAVEVKQAAEMLIADLYLEQVEKRSDAFKTIDSYVIPQLKKAKDVDPDSALARVIQDKIVDLQRKYDLILFRLRNGRPTLSPPYFVRLAQEIGQDTNVTFSPAETTISKSEQSSAYTRTDIVGRYTFYQEDYLSISPEIRFNNTYYFNRIPEIYRNDNYVFSGALRNAYEHTLWKKPASVLFDYDYAEARRDVDAKEKLEFSSRTHSFMIGERFNYFRAGESIIRLRHRLLDSYIDLSDSKTTSLIFEQIKPVGLNVLLLYLSYDMMRVKEDSFDTNSLMMRGDLIMNRVRDWFTPILSLGITVTDPINDRDNRGTEILFNPGARLSKTFNRFWRASLKYEYQKNNSKDEDDFAYTKSIYAFELEYLF